MAVNLNVSSWAPVGETALDLFIERSNMIGIVLGAVAYGAFVTLWFTCVHYELKGKPAREISWGLLVYLVALLAAASIYIATAIKWMQQMFIDFRNFHLDSVNTSPSDTGPLGFYNDDYDTPMIVTANAAYILLNFLADGLVLHRCYVIWNFNKPIMILPTLVFLGSTAISIATVINNSHPSSQFFGASAKAFATSWVVLSMTLNIGLTLLIVGKLLHARARLVKVLGKEHARLYSGIAAMLVESAALYSITSLVFLICYEQTGPAAQFVNVVLPILSMTMAIAPTLILVRVARGRAFTKSTGVSASTGVSIGGTRSGTRPGAPHSHHVSVPLSPMRSAVGTDSHVSIGPSKTRLDEEAAGELALGSIMKTEESVTSYM